MGEDDLKRSRILVVDDQEPNVRLVERILHRAGYDNVRTTTDPRQAVPLFKEQAPDLVVLDLLMPHMDGFEVMEELARAVPDGVPVPILVLTADTTPEAKHRALSMGARDFLTKPFESTEVLLRIRNLLEIRALYLRLADRAADLEREVRARTRGLEDALDAARRQSEHRRHMLDELHPADRGEPAGSLDGHA